MSAYMKLLCRWYSDQHVTAEEFHALGKSSLPYFAQQMNSDPARWLDRVALRDIDGIANPRWDADGNWHGKRYA